MLVYRKTENKESVLSIGGCWERVAEQKGGEGYSVMERQAMKRVSETKRRKR